MTRIYNPTAYKTQCIICLAEFISRNIRRTYCYEESCKKARRRHGAASCQPCSICDRPSIGKGLCPTHYTEQWKIDNPERYTHTCEQCGVEFKTWRKVMSMCSPICQRQSAIKVARAAPRAQKSTDLVLWVRPRTWGGTATTGKMWTSGPCAECGKQFTAQGLAKYCSSQCRNARKWQTVYARYGQFRIPTRERLAIYARDRYTCQLCLQLVDMTLDNNHRMSATLDHIIPQSLSTKPNHNASNLRLAHRMCNSIRGNRIDAEGRMRWGIPSAPRAA